MKKIAKILLSLSVFIIVIIFWIYTTHYTDTPESLLPKISSVYRAFLDLVNEGVLQQDLLISITRVVRGYLTSVVIGVILGTAMGMSKTVWRIFHMPVTAIRQIPMMAWIPLIILWCGIGELTKTVVIVLAAFFPIMTNTLSGVASTPQNYVEVAKLYKLSKWKIFKKVYLPHALPHILVGLKLGLGTSWMAVVAAELLASSSGIGYRLSRARSLMRSDIVIACMIVIGIIGLIMDKGLSGLFSILTPWQDKKQEV